MRPVLWLALRAAAGTARVVQPQPTAAGGPSRGRRSAASHRTHHGGVSVPSVRLRAPPCQADSQPERVGFRPDWPRFASVLQRGLSRHATGASRVGRGSKWPDLRLRRRRLSGAPPVPVLMTADNTNTVNWRTGWNYRRAAANMNDKHARLWLWLNDL